MWRRCDAAKGRRGEPTDERKPSSKGRGRNAKANANADADAAPKDLSAEAVAAAVSRLSLSDVQSDAAPSQLNDTDVRAAGRGRGAKGARGAAVGRSTGRGRGGNPKGGDPSTGEPPAVLYAGMCALAQLWASPSVPLVLLCDSHFALLLGSMCRTVYSRTALPSACYH